MKALTSALLLASLGFCAWLDHSAQVAKAERLQWAVTAEQVAREGKSDKAWYEKHRMKGGSSAQAKTPQADR